jgi:hypothetical protein
LEADFVTDALSNRFRKQNMLNLKADYALGNGKWRIMGGYEIQHLVIKLLKVKEQSNKSITGEETTAPNGLLLQRDFDRENP